MHFNVSYYAAIRHCVENGLIRFEPGAGGDFKRLRGFDPQPTVSMHYLTDPRLHEAVSSYLVRERDHTDRSIDWMWKRVSSSIPRQKKPLSTAGWTWTDQMKQNKIERA